MQTVNCTDFSRELVESRTELVRQAAAIMGSLSDAEDLVQSAMERALRRRHTLRPDTCLRAWLATVTRNLAIDQLRQRWRCERGHVDVTNMPGREQEPRPWWDDVEDQDIRRALDGCSPALRQAFELRHYGGLSLASIAARTRVPIGTVATRIFRARAHIRQVLAAEREHSAAEAEAETALAA